jgi:hypothetical protein
MMRRILNRKDREIEYYKQRKNKLNKKGDVIST